MMISDTRAQRLVDEFEQGRDFAGGFSISHGLAAVLLHLVATEADPESWGAVPASRLDALANALIAPTLLERAMAGDATAARQFLHQAGFTDEQGQWLPQYQSTPEALPND